MDNFWKNTSKMVQDAFESFASISKFVHELSDNFTQISKSIAPVVKFVIENEQYIENYLNSIESLKIFYPNINDIPINQLTVLIENLINEHKIYIDEDWSIKINDEPKVDSSKSKVSIDRMIAIVGLLFSIKSSYTPTNDFSYIDESTTYHIENHYHIEQPTYLQNEQVIMKDQVNLHINPDENSDIVSTLEIGIVVNSVTTENEWTLIVVLDDENNLNFSGWIKSEFVNPVIPNL